MSEKTMVIVTMSGQLQLDGSEPITPERVYAEAEKQWGVKREHMVDPFVVTHDQINGTFEVASEGAAVAVTDGLRKVIRAVLPLKEQEG